MSKSYTNAAHKTSFSSNGENFSKLILSFISPGQNCVEIGAGPGVWTKRLLPYFSSISVIDSSLNMIFACREFCKSKKLNCVCANFFSNPIKRHCQFDCVFGAFWISHVPIGGYLQFWKNIHSLLKIGGHALFLDSYPYATVDSGNFRRNSKGECIEIIKIDYSSKKYINITKILGFEANLYSSSNYTYLIHATKIA